VCGLKQTYNLCCYVTDGRSDRETDYLLGEIIRDLRSFEIRLEFESDVPIRIRFESDVPIRKFRISRTCRVPLYHKLRSLTVQQKHQPLRRL